MYSPLADREPMAAARYIGRSSRRDSGTSVMSEQRESEAGWPRPELQTDPDTEVDMITKRNMIFRSVPGTIACLLILTAFAGTAVFSDPAAGYRQAKHTG